jgi:hypothetical protein
MKRKAVVVLVVIVVGFMVVSIVAAFFRPPADDRMERDISAVIEDGREGRIAEISVEGNSLLVTLRDGSSYKSRKEEGVSVVTVLTDGGAAVSNISIKVEEPGLDGLPGVILNFLPTILIVGGIVYFLRRRARPLSAP